MKLTIKECHERERTWASERTYRSMMKKSRLFIFADGESILENLAYRHNRPTKLYKEILPEILVQLGLPADTKAVWNQKAGCSCGCSPGFVLDITTRKDYYATVEGEAAKVVDTDEARAVAAYRLGELDRQGITEALRAAVAKKREPVS